MSKICFKCHRDIDSEYETVRKDCKHCDYFIERYSHKGCDGYPPIYGCPSKIREMRKLYFVVVCQICREDTVHQDREVKIKKCCDMGRSYYGNICCKCTPNNRKSKKYRCDICFISLCETHSVFLNGDNLCEICVENYDID